MLERLRNRNQEVSALKLDDQKWHRKSYPEGLPEVIPRSGTGSHTRKPLPEVVLEVIPGRVPEVVTGSGTGSGIGIHDPKGHWKP